MKTLITVSCCLFAAILLISADQISTSEFIGWDSGRLVQKQEARVFHAPSRVHNAALTSFPMRIDANAVTTQNVFFIRRSNNRNEVHYDARLTSDCRFDAKAVDYYWHNLEKGEIDIHGEYQDILESEVSAYGFKVVRKSDTEIIINKAALPNNPISVQLKKEGSECIVSSKISINSREADFRSVFLQLNDWDTDAVYVYILGYQNQERTFEIIEHESLLNDAASFTGTPDKKTPPNEWWESNAPRFGRP